MDNLCVPDASSIIFSTKIELAGNKLIDLLNREYKVIISEKVKEECADRTRTTEIEVKEDVDRFMYIKNEDIVYSSFYEDCLKVVKRWFNRKNMQRFSDLGGGEKHCTALALYLNHVKSNKVVVLIDDFKASSLIKDLLNEQKIGMLESIPDFIIQCYNWSRTITQNQVLAALSTYFSISPNGVRKTLFNERFEASCRALGFDICRMRCLFEKS
jgi:hypothetical protein